ncbi:hypothetical protein, partial [Acinetobacter baumannii]|uniref:hypothetical protein n=1 Tax=Acinetobacter baumannii TaxID=470 RepID=UPI0020906A1D
FQKDQTRIAAEKALEELKARGMQFTDVTAGELGRMRDAIKPVVERFSAEYDPAKVRLFNAELQRIQAIN